jgi:hypothetical protein
MQNQIHSNGIEIDLNDDTLLTTLLFPDDHVLLSDSEDDLQTALYTCKTPQNSLK